MCPVRRRSNRSTNSSMPQYRAKICMKEHSWALFALLALRLEAEPTRTTLGTASMRRVSFRVSLSFYTFVALQISSAKSWLNSILRSSRQMRYYHQLL